MAATMQSISTFIHTRRPLWQFVGEDNILRILCHQYIVDWAVVEQLQSTFHVKIRDVMNHGTYGVVITIVLNGGE